MKVLILGEEIRGTATLHYSDYKTINLAKGFSELGYDSYVPHGRTNIPPGDVSRVLDLKDLSIEGLMSFDLIIFTREQWMKRWLQHNSIYTLIYKRQKLSLKAPVVCMRMGGHTWAKGIFHQLEEFYRLFDFHFPQTQGQVKRFVADLGAVGGDFRGKIWGSTMAVPNKIAYEKFKYIDCEKKNIIYMGRLRQNPSKFSFLIKLMTELGSEYQLNVLPGSFSKDVEGIGHNKFGPEVPENLNWLKGRLSSCKNIKVHQPQAWGNHWKYLLNADVAIDFSPSLNRKGFGGGNAKLFEYLRSGLRVVTEPGANNNYLIPRYKAGIIVSGIGKVEEYISGIKKIISDKDYIRGDLSERVREGENWTHRAQEILDNVGMVNEKNYLGEL